MHVHIGVVEFLAFVAMYIILRFFWRELQVRFNDQPLGKALAYLD